MNSIGPKRLKKKIFEMINQHINCGSPLNKNIFSPTNFINLFSMLLVLYATFLEKQLYATKILSEPPKINFLISINLG